ncbi:MAG TPA: hypothetical protein VHA30_00040 [Patescibacteria group bacterium]|nr:hypothetical protein [Patescibacteria group bacterium]
MQTQTLRLSQNGLQAEIQRVRLLIPKRFFQAAEIQLVPNLDEEQAFKLIHVIQADDCKVKPKGEVRYGKFRFDLNEQGQITLTIKRHLPKQVETGPADNLPEMAAIWDQEAASVLRREHQPLFVDETWRHRWPKPPYAEEQANRLRHTGSTA